MGPMELIGEFNYETGGWNSNCLNKERSFISIVYNYQDLFRQD